MGRGDVRNEDRKEGAEGSCHLHNLGQGVRGGLSAWQGNGLSGVGVMHMNSFQGILGYPLDASSSARVDPCVINWDFFCIPVAAELNSPPDPISA